MFGVCVSRVAPYVEELWYEFDTLDEAMGYARDYARLYGVDEVTVFNPDYTVYDVLS